MNVVRSLQVAVCIAVAVIAVFIGWGSRDAASFDDHGLLVEPAPVRDEDNGYLQLTRLQQNGASLFADRRDDDIVKAYAFGARWNDAEAQRLLDAHLMLLAEIRAANQRAAFRFPQVKTAQDLPPYVAYVQSGRLLLMASRLAARRQQWDKAIEWIGEALRFSARIQRDDNGLLVTWTVGNTMQAEALAWVQQMTAQTSLTAEQIVNLQSLLQQYVPAFEQDGFSAIAGGEMRFAVSNMQQRVAQSLAQRMAAWKARREYFDAQASAADYWRNQLYAALMTFLPRFYLHPMAVNAVTAERSAALRERSNHYCNVLPAVVAPQNKRIGWAILLAPNALGEQMLGVDDGYRSYLENRCFFHVYADAIKTLVAIRAYQTRNAGSLPDTLEKLLPDYLSALPRDYFNGETLKYSAKDHWLYSVGADLKDDGGNEAGVFRGKCDASRACYQQPTVLVPDVSAKLQPAS